MKTRFPLGRGVSAVLGLTAAACGAFAQTTASTAPAPTSNEPVLKLDQFTVTAEGSSGYRATNSITATGIGTRIADTPLAISVITSELMKDTSAMEMREALNFVPGVLTNPRSESAVTIRGFGGLISYRNGQYRRQLMTTWNMDRIEVIKGPSAIFFGAVRPGGIVNNVTTKPVLSGDFTDTKVTFGNEGHYQAEFFHNQVINDQLAIRVGAGFIDVGGERDFEYRKEYYGGVSALWRLSERQQITLDLEAIDRKVFYLSSYPVRALANSRVLGNPAAIAAQATLNRQNTTADSANRAYLTSLGFSGTFGAANFVPLYDTFAPIDYGVSLSNDATQWQEANAVDLEYLFRINDSLVWQSSLNYAYDNTTGLQPSDGDTRPYADGTFRFRVEEFINIRNSYNFDNKLTWSFATGPIKHTLQIGQEFARVIFDRPGWLNAANQYNNSPGNTGSSAINPYVTSFLPGVTTPVSLRAVITASGQSFNIDRRSWDNAAGYFLVDQVKMFDDRLFILGGARYNDFSLGSSGKTEYSRPVSNSSLSASSPGGLTTIDRVKVKGGLTPQVGGLFKITPALGFFATYSESIEPVFGTDADGKALEPVESTSFDVGLKSELFDGRLAATLSYYDIERANLSFRDTAREIATGRSPYFIFGNSQSTKGIEFDANWSPTDNYQLIFGWSHMPTAETTRSNNAALVGRRFGGIPENTYSFWNRYAFTSGPMKGLTVGFGVRSNEATNLSDDPNNAVVLPSFTVYDAMLAYPIKIAERNVRLQLNIKNVTDELYREGSDGFFGQARTFFLSASTRF